MPPVDGFYTTSDLSRKSGDIIAEALRRPVTITQRNKPRLVILNIEDYEKLLQRSDTRSVGTIETLPEDLLGEIDTAIEAYAQDDESSPS
jgi:prevent-host-death family protein